MRAEEDLTAKLESFIGHELADPGAVRVSGLNRASQGLSRENWPFELERETADGTTREPLLLRRDPLGSVLETDRRIEFAVLRALEGTPVPAPRALFLDNTGESLGRPGIVMERLEGVCDYMVLNGGTMGFDAPKRLELAHDLCDAVAAIHEVDWQTNGLGAVFASEIPPGALRELAHWEAYLAAQILEPQPEMTAVALWLRRYAPEPQRRVLVHGDFKPGNVLLAPEGRIVAVLDWELAHVGDPIEDVGWVTNPYRAAEHIIPGAWEVNDLVARYESQSGLRVTPNELRYWQVFTNFKLAAIVLTGVRSQCEGRSDRIFSYRMVRTFLRRLLDLVPG